MVKSRISLFPDGGPFVKVINCPDCGTPNNVMAMGVDTCACSGCHRILTVIQGKLKDETLGKAAD